MEEEKKEQLKPIFVVYVGVGESDPEEMSKILKSAYDAISPIFNEQKGEVIFIPTRSMDSRIECINPQYITEEELIRKNRLLIDELHEHLDTHIAELLNKENDEDNG